jgi:hypothetical protein
MENLATQLVITMANFATEIRRFSKNKQLLRATKAGDYAQICNLLQGVDSDSIRLHSGDNHCKFRIYLVVSGNSSSSFFLTLPTS